MAIIVIRNGKTLYRDIREYIAINNIRENIAINDIIEILHRPSAYISHVAQISDIAQVTRQVSLLGLRGRVYHLRNIASSICITSIRGVSDLLRVPRASRQIGYIPK